MLLASAALIFKRSEIRARWWAWRLKNSQNSSEISYFSACLAGIGAKGTSAVIPLLNSDRADIRTSAVWILGQARDTSACDALLRSLQDPDDDFRAFSATQLGIAADRDVASRLERVAAEAPRNTAVAAALALEKTQAGNADESLQQLALAGRFPELRAQAIESLGRRRSPNAKSTLLTCLGDQTRIDGLLLGELRDQTVLAAVAQRIPGIPASEPQSAATRTIGDFAARALTRLTGEDCNYRTSPTADDLDRLRRCWTVAPLVPTTLPSIVP